MLTKLTLTCAVVFAFSVLLIKIWKACEIQAPAELYLMLVLSFASTIVIGFSALIVEIWR